MRRARRLLQLTWKSGKAFWYQTSDFQPQSTTTPLHDGWGATYDNATSAIVLSDGSPNLSFVDPASLRLLRSVQARVTPAHHGREAWQGGCSSLCSWHTALHQGPSHR